MAILLLTSSVTKSLRHVKNVRALMSYNPLLIQVLFFLPVVAPTTFIYSLSLCVGILGLFLADPCLYAASILSLLKAVRKSKAKSKAYDGLSFTFC